MAQQQLLAGKDLLAAIEKSGKDRFPDLSPHLQESIAANVPADDRLRGLDFVKAYLRDQPEPEPAGETK